MPKDYIFVPVSSFTSVFPLRLFPALPQYIFDTRWLRGLFLQLFQTLERRFRVFHNPFEAGTGGTERSGYALHYFSVWLGFRYTALARKRTARVTQVTPGLMVSCARRLDDADRLFRRFRGFFRVTADRFQ